MPEESKPKKSGLSRAPFWVLLIVSIAVSALVLMKIYSSEGEVGGADIGGVGRNLENIERSEALSGTQASPDVKRRVQAMNDQEAQEAIRSDDSHMPVMIADDTPPSAQPTLAPEESSTAPAITPAKQEKVGQNRQPPPAYQRQSSQPQSVEARRYERQRSGDLIEAMRQVQNGMRRSAPNMFVVNTQPIEQSENEGQTGNNSPQIGSPEQTPPLPPSLEPGDVLYTVNEYEVDSDYPSDDIVLRVIHPLDLEGGRCFGNFKRQGEVLIIELDRLVHRGAEYSLRGLAINPEDVKANVASEVDTHFFERWGGLLAATFIEGLGDAIAKSNQRTTVNNGTTVTSSDNYSSTEIALEGAGVVGRKAARQFEKNFNRPPTVRLHPGAEVAVIILESNRR